MTVTASILRARSSAARRPSDPAIHTRCRDLAVDGHHLTHLPGQAARALVGHTQQSGALATRSRTRCAASRHYLCGRSLYPHRDGGHGIRANRRRRRVGTCDQSLARPRREPSSTASTYPNSVEMPRMTRTDPPRSAPETTSSILPSSRRRDKEARVLQKTSAQRPPPRAGHADDGLEQPGGRAAEVTSAGHVGLTGSVGDGALRQDLAGRGHEGGRFGGVAREGQHRSVVEVQLHLRVARTNEEEVVRPADDAADEGRRSRRS